jgi:hypothetical protein
MYDFHITDMVDRLIKNDIIDKNDSVAAVGVLKEYWEDKIALSWSAEDVIMRAREVFEVELTTKEACSILYDVQHNYDAERGINWEILDIWIEAEIKRRDSNEG